MEKHTETKQLVPKKERSQWVKKFKGKTNILRQMKIKTQLPKIYRKQQKLRRKVILITCLTQDIRKISEARWRTCSEQ